jgi:hypothetical protein
MASRSQMSQSGTSKEDYEEIKVQCKHPLRFILWSSIFSKKWRSSAIFAGQNYLNYGTVLTK